HDADDEERDDARGAEDDEERRVVEGRHAQVHQRREERHDRERDEDEDVRRGQAPHETTFTWSRRCSYGTPYTLGSLQPSASRSETRTRSPAGSRSTRARASYGCVPAS